jgi:hypothetical protein
MVTFAR